MSCDREGTSGSGCKGQSQDVRTECQFQVRMSVSGSGCQGQWQDVRVRVSGSVSGCQGQCQCQGQDGAAAASLVACASSPRPWCARDTRTRSARDTLHARGTRYRASGRRFHTLTLSPAMFTTYQTSFPTPGNEYHDPAVRFRMHLKGFGFRGSNFKMRDIIGGGSVGYMGEMRAYLRVAWLAASGLRTTAQGFRGWGRRVRVRELGLRREREGRKRERVLC